MRDSMFGIYTLRVRFGNSSGKSHDSRHFGEASRHLEASPKRPGGNIEKSPVFAKRLRRVSKRLDSHTQNGIQTVASRLVANLRALEQGWAMDRATGARCLRGAAAELAGTRNRLARLLSETGGDLAGVAGALRVARRVAGDLDLGETLALAAGKIEEVLDRLDRERQRLDFESEGGAQ